MKQTPSLPLLSTLIYLTLLFMLGQLAFFIAHYQVGSLIDSLVNSTIWENLAHPAIVGPLLVFAALQIGAHVFFTAWIYLLAYNVGHWLRLSKWLFYGAGILLWFFAVGSLLIWHSFYYPNSFFALRVFASLKTLQWLSIILFSLLTLAAYIYAFYAKSKRGLAILLLVPMLLSVGLMLHDHFLVAQPIGSNRLPNVIVIGLDSLRPDFVQGYGSKLAHTPNLDAFLKTAVVFSKAYTPLARTFPAWMSILTGRYPKHHGARNNLVEATHIEKADNLVKHLRQLGYETIYASDEKRFSNLTEGYGFSRLIGPSMGVNDFILGTLSDFPLSNLILKLPLARFLFPYQYANRAAAITYDPDHFLRLLDAELSGARTPLFLTIHLCLSHWPFTWAQDGQKTNALLAERYRLSVERLDRQVGQLFKQLQAKHLLQDSIVVLLSDHGTALGLQGDRAIDQRYYQGATQKLHYIPVTRLASAPESSLDFKNDYTINTAYGQGTEVLSWAQHRVVLAIKPIESIVAPKIISQPVSLMDVAPTVLALLKQPLMAGDGQSLAPFVLGKKTSLTDRPLFFETGDSMSEIETDHINVQKVLKKQIHAYDIQPESGLLYLNARAEQLVICNKQRAVFAGDWILARYPAQERVKLARAKNKPGLVPLSFIQPPFYVLLNVKTHQWVIDPDRHSFPSAPYLQLRTALLAFYRGDCF